MKDILNNDIISLQNMKHWVNIDIKDKKLVEEILNEIETDIQILKQGGNIIFKKYNVVLNKLSKLGQFQSSKIESNINKEWENTILILDSIKQSNNIMEE